MLVSRSFGTAIMHVDGITETCSEFESLGTKRLRGLSRKHPGSEQQRRDSHMGYESGTALAEVHDPVG